MLRNNVVVDYQEDDELEGLGGAQADFRMKFNPEILQRFVDEGKIKLDKIVSADYPHLIINTAKSMVIPCVVLKISLYSVPNYMNIFIVPIFQNSPDSQ